MRGEEREIQGDQSAVAIVHVPHLFKLSLPEVTQPAPYQPQPTTMNSNQATRQPPFNHKPSTFNHNQLTHTHIHTHKDVKIAHHFPYLTSRVRER